MTYEDIIKATQTELHIQLCNGRDPNIIIINYAIYKELYLGIPMLFQSDEKDLQLFGLKLVIGDVDGFVIGKERRLR